MATTDFDPEAARRAALTALEAWARQHQRVPEQQAPLLAAAWYAGERDVTELCRISGLSQPTVYADLRSQGIDAATANQAAPPLQPRFRPLNPRQIANLADHAGTVLLPSMIGPDPHHLADAAWHAHKILRAVAALLTTEDDNLDAGTNRQERARQLDDLVASTHAARRAANQQWASEATDAELAAHALNSDTTRAALSQAILDGAVLTLTLPGGTSRMQVTLTTTGHHEPEPDGWSQWSTDHPLPLAGMDGYRHLELHTLRESLAELITSAVHPDLLDLD